MVLMQYPFPGRNEQDKPGGFTWSVTKFFWRVSGLVPPAEGHFPQVGECSQPKITAGAEAGAAFLAQSCMEPLVAPSHCQECSLVFPRCVPGAWECRAGGQEPQKGNQHLVLGISRVAVSCLWHAVCQTHIPGMGTGMPGQRSDGRG